jgi:serine/threonine protein kinase
MNATDSGEFRGTGRFFVQRRIGSGGMGVVYQAYDQERCEVVAIKTLKTLHGLDGEAIYRLRNEFRARADLVHPNLVNLYELFAEEGRWFFTMEFVRGVNFLEYVRTGWREGTRGHAEAVHRDPAGGEPVSATAHHSTERAVRPGTTIGHPNEVALQGEAGSRETESYTACVPDVLVRLRAALCQLAEGVDVLHTAGFLHRDIKPSNVLVTREGRVVLLDFGLAIARDRAERDDWSIADLVGTVQYMSPEQARQAPLTPASDWYSVGVVLFEALTGRPPLLGRGLELLQRKQEVDSPAPCEFFPGVPDDLNALCVELLRRDPALRPVGAEVFRRLLPAEGARPSLPAAALPAVSRAPFVGRVAHLRALHGTLQLVYGGQTAVVHVSGTSGVGKTALVREFLAQMGGCEDAVLLQGKCHERESIPYKALDAVAESLAHYLVRLPQHEVESLLPRDVVALARVFPILRRVATIAAARPRESDTADHQELRQRAFNGLRELLARLGDRKTLVVHIDDFQWGDLDSAALLRDLLRPPDPPLLLLLLSYRSEDRATSPVLSALLDPQCTAGPGIETREIHVGPLTPEESRELARTLLASGGPECGPLCEAIARESSGNPYFIEALSRRHQSAERSGRATLAISLDEVL